MILTKQQLQIIRLLYWHRYLTSQQVQHLLGKKHHSKIYLQLRSLSEARVISVQPHPDKGNKSRVYSLSTLGRKFLIATMEEDELKGLNRVYRQSKHSVGFIQHCLYLAEIEICISAFEAQENYHWQTAMRLSDEYETSYVPDAFWTTEFKLGELHGFACLLLNDQLLTKAITTKIKTAQHFLNLVERQTLENFESLGLCVIYPNLQIRSMARKPVRRLIDIEETDVYMISLKNATTEIDLNNFKLIE